MARRLGLDAKTLTNICGSLLEAGLIRRSGEVLKGRGRPQEELSIRPEAAFAIGLDIGARQVSCVVTDLAGSVRYEKRTESSHEWKRHEVLDAVDALIRAAFASLSPAERKRIEGIGCAVPGILNREEGTVLHAANIPALSGFSICMRLSELYRVPVNLEEASRAMALSEIWFTDCRRDNFICIDAGFGIGMGIVFSGRLYRGNSELSGEIGHTVVDPRGSRCSCGKRGCLETVASGRALTDLAASMDFSPYGVHGRDARALAEAAAKGCAEAIHALERAGRRIGVAVANAINLFDPGVIILNGGLVQAGGIFVDPIREAVQSHCIGYGGNIPQVQVSTLGLRAGALGASIVPLLRFFEFENIRF